MPDHDLRTTIDALCARLQADLQTQAAQMVDRLAEERENARRETEAKTAEVWAAKIDAVRDEWNGRLQAGLADAAANTERRLAADGERTRLEAEQARLEIEALTKAASEAAERHRQETEALREEWQGRLRAGLADATAEADRRLIAETDRIRREVEQAAAEATERVREQTREQTREETREATRQETREEVRREMEQAAAASAAELRAELEQAATHATARLREDMDQALAAERERAGVELEGERTRVQALVAAERDRSAADLEGERLKTLALSAALEEARAAVAREREAAQHATASLQAVRSEQSVHDAQAVVDARASERQAQLAVVERLLGAVRSIDGARSLSDTLTSLTDAAGTVAPRAALFVVSRGVSRGASRSGSTGTSNRAADGTDGQDLQGWHAAGFDAASPVGLRLADADRAARGLLDLALASGNTVSTASEPAPAFAKLPVGRAGLAVPIIVGGQSVAVLYADDAAAVEPEAPASWPEAIQVLAAHASACLEQITAVRTTQALQHASASSATGAAAKPIAAGSAGHEEDSSARRYARLLVSEIKLYNEAAVRTGREKRDLLNRLAPEIDRARQLYEERVSPAVGARAAYFQQELVHTLADGDSALLGGAA